MSRVIKFRAWNGEEMVSPDYIDRKGIAHWKENSIPESTDKVMQFTGLLDKNGKEMYEGDILQTGKYADWKSIVKYMPGGWYASLGDKVPGIPFTERSQPLASFLFEHYDWFIIGNIYENPELIQ